MALVERRRASRVSAELPVSFEHGTEAFTAQTRNLSASGVYCTLRRFIEPMTKLRMWLDIPSHPQPTRLSCEGVVVRVEPPRPTPGHSTYHLAIFFNDLAARDRLVIAHYVQQLQGK